MCRWLYRLNWHIKDLLDEARKQQGLPADELFKKAAELTKLKNDVLCKLIIEGYAKIDKKHVIHRKTYYCVQITDRFSFHSAELERIEEAVRVFEQKEKGENASEREQTGADKLLYT
jgi:hypothetical protein